MQQYLAILAVAAGGAIGSVSRYLFSNWFLQIVGPGFPWGTFTINVTGAFIIGVVLQTAAGQPDFSPYLRLFLATGILGGYTTFSTFAYESYNLGSTNRVVEALLYVGGSVVLGIAAAILGVLSARILASR
jgi:CrcB protein